MPQLLCDPQQAKPLNESTVAGRWENRQTGTDIDTERNLYS